MKPPWAALGTIALTSTIALTGAAAQALPGGSAPGPARDLPQAVGTVSAHGFFWQLTAPQRVRPGTRLVAHAGGHPRSEGTRSDDEFFAISSTGSNDVPQAALRAYRRAEAAMARSAPDCEVSWTLLAAIGRVESNHGRFGGAQLGVDGVSRPAIRGPRLDGAGPFAAIRDTDDGRLDRDRVWDRAVGQMQFLPETWRSVARDGDGDGRLDPFDLDDSALGAAVYLCGAGGSLANADGMARAAFRYNHSDYYVSLVLAFQTGYQTGVFAIPSPPPPPKKQTDTSRDTGTTKAARPRSEVKPGAAPKSTPPRPPRAGPTPVRPSPSPTPTPTKPPKPVVKPSAPAPTPVGPRAQAGTWRACGPGFCVGSTALDLGPASRLADRAGADFDRDGAVESNGEELSGLVGKQVHLQVVPSAGGLVVYVIDGHGWRNADGSFARTVAAPDDTP